jgi:hypothetical protein
MARHDEPAAIELKKEPSMLIINTKWSCQSDEAQTAAGLEAAGCVVLVYMQVNSRISIVIPGTDARKRY